MDKNTLLAVILSGVIMVGWYAVFPPPEPPPRDMRFEADLDEKDQVKKTYKKDSLDVDSPNSSIKFSQPLESINKVDFSLPSKEVLVETSNYRLIIDTRGGIGKKLQLKNFNHTKPRLTLSTWFPVLTGFIGPDFKDQVTEENLVEMFGNHLKDVPAFSLEFENDAKTSEMFRNSVFASSKEEILLSGEEKALLILTSPILNGFQLIKTFEFSNENYIFDYRIQLINRSNEIRPIEINYLFGEQRLSDSDGGIQQYAHEGPVFFYDESLQTLNTEDIGDGIPVTQMKWLGLEDQYFISATAPLTNIKNGFFRADFYSSNLRENVQVEKKLSPYFGVSLPKTNLQPNLLVESNFKMYYGPKADEELIKFGNKLLDSHDMTLEVLASPLLDLLRMIYTYVGNYGVAIIILTIIVRVFLFPLTFKGMKSMKRMQQLAPRMKKLQEKYKNNKEKLNKEMMELYRRNKVNPLGGCLPMLLQIPVFFALYSALSSAVELRHAPFIFWLGDLSQPDGLGITPILMGLTMYIQQKMTPQTAMMDSTQAKIMQMLPFIFTIFTFTFPSGLTLYWVTSNILSIGQQKIINRIKTPEMQD